MHVREILGQAGTDDEQLERLMSNPSFVWECADALYMEASDSHAEGANENWLRPSLSGAVVFGPSPFGALVAYEMARRLGCRTYRTEPLWENGRVVRHVLRADIQPGSPLILATDVIRTGETLHHMIRALLEAELPKTDLLPPIVCLVNASRRDEIAAEGKILPIVSLGRA